MSVPGAEFEGVKHGNLNISRMQQEALDQVSRVLFCPALFCSVICTVTMPEKPMCRPFVFVCLYEYVPMHVLVLAYYIFVDTHNYICYCKVC
jgi:hypothetical protein